MGEPALGPRLAGLAALFALAPASFAQEVYWERTGVANQHQFGGPTALLGDLDQDGYPELIHQLGVLAGNPPFQRVETQLWVLSGKDGRTLRKVRPPGPVEFGALTETGDMDGDGLADYAVELRFSTPRTVEVRSGRDDSLIWSVQGSWSSLFGMAILGDLDLDGDGRPDLLVTTANSTPHGELHAFSNQGTLLYRLPGTPQLVIGTFQSDQTLGRMGDVDGDGADDFVVGGGDPTVPAGAAIVISGKAGNVLAVGRDPRPGDNIGHSVDGCGDMDGDGIPDFVAGNTATFRRGVVAAFSGASGALLHAWTSTTLGTGFEGHAVRSEGIDVDQDGVPDVVVGAPQYQGGAVFVFSGRGGSILFLETDPARNRTLGASIAALRTWPGHPFPLFAVSNFDYGYISGSNLPRALGRLRVYRGSPAGVRPLGPGCAGTLSAAPRIGLRDLGAAGARVHLSNAPAGAPAFLLLGTSTTSSVGQLLLPHDGSQACALYTTIEAVLAVTTGTVGINAGYAFIDLPVPLSGGSGVTLNGQWLVVGPGQSALAALSGGLSWQH